ncbi:MAG: NYN domain-containing protein [Porticoccaceae bacterium]
MKQLALFADVQNIYYTVKQTYGCHFNYRELWHQLAQEGDISCANAYAIDRNNPQQQGFQQVLREIGFTVKLKPYIQRIDGSAKGDWDVGIAIDMMDAAINQTTPIDCAVLLSGDGDFDLLLQRLSVAGIDTLVYGVPELTATSLINTATEFRAIEGALLLQ